MGISFSFVLYHYQKTRFKPTILLYLLFPSLRMLYKHRILGTLLITALFLVNLKLEFLTEGNGYFSITNGIMYFWLGMLFEAYRNRITLTIRMILIAPLAGLLLFNPQSIFQIPYLPCFFVSVLLYPVLFGISYSSPFTKHICEISYELYFVHHRVFIILIPVFLGAISTSVQFYLCLIILTWLVSVLAAQLKRATGITAGFKIGK